MLREQKETFVEQMRSDLERAAGVLFLDFTGITVQDVDSLRRKFREADITYKVVKNTLMKRAMADTPYESAGKCLSGAPTGVVVGFDDPVTAAKLTFEFLKDNEKVKVKGGIVENKAITPKEAEALSKMPSKAEVQASIVSLALSPGRMLAAQIKDPAARIVGAIDKLVENLEKKGQ